MALAQSRPSPAPRVEHRLEAAESVLHLAGPWRLAHLGTIVRTLALLEAPVTARCTLDGSSLEALDASAAYVLLRHLRARGCSADSLRLRGFAPAHRRLLALVQERAPGAPPERRRRLGWVRKIGAATQRLGRLLARHVAFLGAVALEILDLVRRPARFRLRETAAQLEAACLDAIPVVALVSFLIGVVVAYLLGVQAVRYGANIFVVDGLALAVSRELSPLLASIIVAGRSGAAFTAQIGTMKVGEEIDAIAVLGLSPIQVLVIPRLLALVLALPLLVFLGDVAGLAGGMLVSAWQLGIGPVAFVDRLQVALRLDDFLVGILKAPVFAVVIAMIGCHMGMAAARAARSVGDNTTSTVVQSIVSVILLDALFAVLQQQTGI